MIFHQLKPWHELIGIFENIESDDDVVIVTISGFTLRYMRRTPEGEFLIQNLLRKKIGSEVGILNAEKEFRIQWPGEQSNRDGPFPFWKWYCKTYGIPEGGALK